MNMTCETCKHWMYEEIDHGHVCCNVDSDNCGFPREADYGCAQWECEEADKDVDIKYQKQIEQFEHDTLYEPTFNPEDGSM